MSAVTRPGETEGMLRDVPEMSGKYIVEDTDATTPMIENANAIVSISYGECTTSV